MKYIPDIMKSGIRGLLDRCQVTNTTQIMHTAGWFPIRTGLYNDIIYS